MNFPQICDDNAAQLHEVFEPRGDDWRSDDAPPNETLVRIIAKDQRGTYEIPFAVLFKDDKWLNASTREELDCFVAGWREWKDRRTGR